MKLTLKRVIRRQKDKAGNKLLTKAGKEYERVSIQTEEHGDKWLSGFGSSWNDNWNEGDVVNAKVEQKGEYLNFSKEDPMEGFDARLKRLEDEVFGSKTKAPDDGAPDIQIEDDDIPF